MFLFLILAVNFMSKVCITGSDVLASTSRKMDGCGRRSKRFRLGSGTSDRLIATVRSNRMGATPSRGSDSDDGAPIALCRGFCHGRARSCSTSNGGSKAVHMCAGAKSVGLTYLVGNSFPRGRGRVTISEVRTSGINVGINSAVGIDKGRFGMSNLVTCIGCSALRRGGASVVFSTVGFSITVIAGRNFSHLGGDVRCACT